MSYASHRALRQSIESMLRKAKQEYFDAVELTQQNKCSPLRLSHLQGFAEGLEKAWGEAVHAETEAKGGEA